MQRFLRIAVFLRFRRGWTRKFYGGDWNLSRRTVNVLQIWPYKLHIFISFLWPQDPFFAFVEFSFSWWFIVFISWHLLQLTLTKSFVPINTKSTSINCGPSNKIEVPRAALIGYRWWQNNVIPKHWVRSDLSNATAKFGVLADGRNQNFAGFDLIC